MYSMPGISLLTTDSSRAIVSFIPPKSALEAYTFLTVCVSDCLCVCPSISRVWSIAPILFEVGIPNSISGYTLGSWRVAFYFRVTVTLISGLNSRKIVSGAYLQYYLR